MKKVFISLAAAVVAAAMMCSCGTKQAEPVAEEQNDTVVVYMTREITPESLVKIYEAIGRPAATDDHVAVKISTGEAGGHNYLKPELIGQLVKQVNGTLVECNTAYPGKRYTFKDHWKTIKDHGFLDIAKVDLMDEEGDDTIPCLDTTRLKYDIVGKHLKNYNYMINLAHFKGHAMGGFGGVLKNQSIGVASAAGKAYIHSAGKSSDKVQVWNNIPADEEFDESMAAAAQAVANYFGEKIVYIDVMNNMSIDCDCDSDPDKPLLKDYGILGSTDPVALDQACLDIIFGMDSTADNNPEPLKRRITQKHGTHTVDYAAKIGLGKKVYKIVCVD